MIKEEYIQFHTAKLLKDAGFPQDIKQTMFYNKFGQDWHMGDHHWTNGFAKPSQAQAMRWLREDKDLHVSIWLNPEHIGVWEYTIEHITKDADALPGGKSSPTYEDAAEAGIQAACEYLIEKGGAGSTPVHSTIPKQ